MSAGREPQLVAVRCRRFEVRVTLDPFGGLSPLEQHLLLAVAVGRTTVTALADHLALPQRLVLNACVELLQAGRLHVDPNGEIMLSPGVRRAIGDDPTHPDEGWAQRLISSASPEPYTVVMLQEQLSGALIELPSGPGIRESTPLFAPVHPDVPRLEELPKIELILALGRAQRVRRDDDSRARPQGEQKPLRIRDVQLLRTAQARTTADARLLRTAQARASSDETIITVSLLAQTLEPGDDQPPLFRIVGPDAIPVVIRRRMAARLTDLWQRGYGRGPRQFFTRLTIDEQSDDEAVSMTPSRPRAWLRQLQNAWEQARGGDPAEVHGDLSERERFLWDELSDAIQYAAQVEPVSGRSNYRAQLQDALNNAEKQVVIADAGVDALADDDELSACVRDAAERGVTVHLVQTARHHAKSGKAAHEWTHPFAEHQKTGRGGGVMVTDRPANADAQFVICDLDWMCVSGAGSAVPTAAAGTNGIGVRIAAREERRTARAITGVLTWTRSLLPDFRLRPLLIDSPVLFGKSYEAKPAVFLPPVPPPQDGPFAKLWPILWNERVRYLAGQLDNALPLAMPVFDSDHRLLFLHAAESVERRLLVESPRITPAGLSQWLCDALVAAVKRGVSVCIAYEERRAFSPAVEDRWRALADAGVSLVERRVPAPTIACDDWCIVGKFPYLAPVPSGWRTLGVRIFDDALVESLLRGVKQQSN